MGDLSLQLIGVGKNERTGKIEVTPSLSSTRNSCKMEVSFKTPIAICKQISALPVEFTIQNPEPVERSVEDSTWPSIASALIKKAKSHGRPTKKNLVKNNLGQLYKDLIDYLAEKRIAWTSSANEITSANSVTSLTNLLWHITNHHDTFKVRAASLPDFVAKFVDYNDYIVKQQTKPVLKEPKLRTFVNELSNFLILSE